MRSPRHAGRATRHRIDDEAIEAVVDGTNLPPDHPSLIWPAGSPSWARPTTVPTLPSTTLPAATLPNGPPTLPTLPPITLPDLPPIL